MIIQGLGNKENIKVVTNCFSRLRVQLVDTTKINEEILNQTECSGIVKTKDGVQIIYGLSVPKIKIAVNKKLNLDNSDQLLRRKFMKEYIVVIAGGGSTFTPGVVKALLTKKNEFKLKELRVYDNDAERQRKVSIITKSVVDEMDSGLKFSQHTEPKEAFENADFIFAQIRVGKYPMRELDEKIPLSLNAIGQETCGPGGMAYALRTIEPMIEIVDYMEKYSNSNCWMINYSNLALIVAEAMRRIRPNSKVLNICDMPVGMMQKMTDVFKCEYEDIEPEYFGLNHFGWFTSLKVKGIDRTQEMKDFIKENGLFPKNNYDLQHKDASWQKTYKNMKYMMNLFEEYIPNTYMQYYLLGDLILQQLNKEYTRANEVMDGREATLFKVIDEYEKTGKYDKEAFHVGAHGLFIVDVANSLANDMKKKYLVIVENKVLLKIYLMMQW